MTLSTPVLRSTRSDEATALDSIALTEDSLIVPFKSAIAPMAADLSLSHKLASADSVIYACGKTHPSELVIADDHFFKRPARYDLFVE